MLYTCSNFIYNFKNDINAFLSIKAFSTYKDLFLFQDLSISNICQLACVFGKIAISANTVRGELNVSLSLLTVIL